jgi:hypothetical protein
METNQQPYPFGQKGTILSGEHPGWTVELVDDTAETGGYFIFIEDPNPHSPDFIGFDWWLEHAANIPGFIEAMNWQIEWHTAGPTTS